MSKFDPNKIRVSNKTETLANLLQLVGNDLQFSIENGSVKYDNVNWSCFVEAAIVRMPLAPILVQEILLSQGDRSNYIWQLKVNINLLVSIFAFTQECFCLTNLKFLPDFEGMFWSRMPKYIQRRILQTNVAVTVIEVGTPEKIAEEIIFQYKQQIKL
jgi:hypothetical protein